MGSKQLIDMPERNQAGLLSSKEAAYDASVSFQTPKMVKTTDAFSNLPARLGAGSENLMQATQYPLTRMSQNYNLLNSLFRSNWVVGNIISTIPEDVTKKWYNVVTAEKSQDEVKKFQRMERQIRLRSKIIDGMKWGRLYGGALGVILIKGEKNLELPLDLNRIMPDSFKGLYIVDRWSGCYPDLELVDDITDPDFGLPKYYNIRGIEDAYEYRIHHSRVIRFIGVELPYFERIAEQYWGKSVIESVYDEIVKKDNVSHNIASLTFKANLDVIEMESIDQLLGMGGEQAQARFWNVMQAQSVIQSNLGVRILNKGDKFNQFQYAFTGLRDVYETLLLDVSGSVRIPATRLFGRSPQGLNATGKSDQINYDDYLEEVRESSFKPIIDKLLPIMALSAWGEIPDDLEAEYDAIASPDETEKATIAQRKVGVIIDLFAENMIPLNVALLELKSMSHLITMFKSITDEQIREAEGKFKKDIEFEQDPLAGLSGYSEMVEETPQGTFEEELNE